MNKNEAKMEFEALWLDEAKSHNRPNDKSAIRLYWNNFVDGLQKDGKITKRQADNWVNPFLSKKDR